MSVPVAGRRKGLATTAAPGNATGASSPSAASPAMPSWLDDAGPSTASPFVFSDAAPSVAGAGAASPAASPVNALAQILTPTASVIAASASPLVENNAGLPAFLLEEEAAGAPAKPSAPIALTSVQAVPAAAVEAERQRRRALTEELHSVTQQLQEATGHVETLQGESHTAAVEVRELEATLVSMRAKEAEGQRLKAERDARVQREARSEAVSAVAAAANNADVDHAVAAYRAELTDNYEKQLSVIQTELETQQKQNALLQRECEELMSTTPEARCQATAFDALQRRLQDGVRHLKQHFAQESGNTVAHTARDFLAAARQQREEVFANDTARRTAQLHQYQAQRTKSMEDFYAECHGVLQGRADSLFGALKTSLEKRRRQAEYERDQRLSAFHARLQSMTERGRVSLEQQVRARVEQEVGIANAQRESAHKELTLRQEELAQQRRAFLSRAEAEYESLRETRGSRSATQSGNKTTFTSASHEDDFSTAPTAARKPTLGASVESLRRNMEEMCARLGQICLTIRTKQQSLQSSAACALSPLKYSCTSTCRDDVSYPSRPMPGASSGLKQPWVSFEEAVTRWRDAVVSLQQRREFLRKTVAELTASTQAWSNTLQHGRRHFTEQRESAHAVRREWETHVRGQLSRCLTAQSPEVPPPASLTTSALEDLTSRLGELTRKQGAVRTSRGAFAAQVSTWVEVVGEYRSRTECLLGDIFTNFDALRDKSVRVEVDALTLRSMEAQMDVLHQHVSGEAHRLATQKRQLDALMKEVGVGRLVAAPLPPPSTASPDPLTNGHSTQIFNGSTSPLFDITNASSRGLHCHQPSQEPPDPSEKAESASKPPPPPPLPSQQHPPSSATTRSLAAASRGGGSAGKEASTRTVDEARARGEAEKRVSHTSNAAATTTVSASSGADLFGSESPSPIMPSLEGHSGWYQQTSVTGTHGGSGGVGGGALAAGAYLSVSPQTDDAPMKAIEETLTDPRRSMDTETDFNTELEPLEDDVEDDDFSDIAPLRPYR